MNFHFGDSFSGIFFINDNLMLCVPVQHVCNYAPYYTYNKNFQNENSDENEIIHEKFGERSGENEKIRIGGNP